jgi:hypothetical protein
VSGDHLAQTGRQIRRRGNRGLLSAIAIVAIAIIAGIITLTN